MELHATYAFDAPAEQVWNTLMDPDAVGRCLPGGKGLHEIGPDRYEVALNVAVAAIAGNFTATVAIEDKNPPNSYTLVVDGTGRQGFVNGSARISLQPDGDRTQVHVAAQADVGGTIARVGQRLLEGVARATMDRFYGCLKSAVGR